MTHVLVVDDDTSVRDTLARMIEHAGAVAVACSGAHDALRVLGQRRFSLLITDFDMPGLTGLELAQEALRLQSNLPVVVTSGMPIGAKVCEAGLEFLPKPFALEDVVELVRSVTLAHSRPVRVAAAPRSENDDDSETGAQ